MKRPFRVAENIRWGSELLLFGLVLWTLRPLFVVDHPPIQDLPQHLAAMRVLTDYGDPSLGFSRYFDVSLLRTQYLAYYAAVRVVAMAVGVELANRLVLALALAAAPYAMRSLLQSIGRDPRYALLVLPLTYNAHLILGFLNFVAAIPLALYGLSLAAQLRHEYRRSTAVWLGVVTVVCFYTHVVPFAFLGVGAALIGLRVGGGGLRETVARWLPLVPGGVAAILWSLASPAGQATVTAAAGPDAATAAAAQAPVPRFMAAPEALRQIPSWLTDVFTGDADIKALLAWAGLFLFILAMGAGGDATSTSPAGRRNRRMLRIVGAMAPLAVIGYFVLPASYDWIWPINARFPLLALLFAVPLLPRLRGAAAAMTVTITVTLCVVHGAQARDAFVAYESEEVGALDEAIEQIPKGSRVAGLIYDRGSRHVAFSPFIHSVAWVQARRGGAVMFTFTDFPQSPIVFREDQRPPRVPPRWEWTPERVRPDTDLAWYEYVLVRGGPGRIARSSTFERIWSSERWRVYRRRAQDGTEDP